MIEGIEQRQLHKYTGILTNAGVVYEVEGGIKRYPVCPCAMAYVEEVDGGYYRIRQSGGEYTAEYLGPVGGPYNN